MMTLRQTALAAGAAGMILISAMSAAAQVRELQGETIKMTVTIETIDRATRTITVKDDKGLYETIYLPPEIRRFDELKVGDKITAGYSQTLVVRVKKPGEPAVDVLTAGAGPGTGARPSAAAATQRTVTVTITALDPAAQSATVTGPNGFAYSRRVADKNIFAQLKVGDRLDMTWTDALMVSVDTPTN